MTGQFEVEHATLHTAASDVRSTRSEVDGELKKLWGVVDDLAIAWKGSASAGFQNLMSRWNEDVQQLLQAMDWEGSDQAAYHGYQAQWDAAVRDINQILNEIGNAVGIARENYVSTETSNAKLWG